MGRGSPAGFWCTQLPELLEPRTFGPPAHRTCLPLPSHPWSYMPVQITSLEHATFAAANELKIDADARCDGVHHMGLATLHDLPVRVRSCVCACASKYEKVRTCVRRYVRAPISDTRHERGRPSPPPPGSRDGLRQKEARSRLDKHAVILARSTKITPSIFKEEVDERRGSCDGWRQKES